MYVSRHARTHTRTHERTRILCLYVSRLSFYLYVSFCLPAYMYLRTNLTHGACLSVSFSEHVHMYELVHLFVCLYEFVSKISAYIPNACKSVCLFPLETIETSNLIGQNHHWEQL